MTLTESIVEDAALEWFGELGYAPGEPAAEREPERSGDSRRQSFGEVVQSHVARTLTRPLPRGEEKEREAIRRLNPAIPEGARATVRQYRRVQISTGRETMP